MNRDFDLSIHDYIRIFRKRFWVILLSIIVCILFSFAYMHWKPKFYTSTAELQLLNPSPIQDITRTTILVRKTTLSTAPKIITSRSILNIAASQLYEKLNKIKENQGKINKDMLMGIIASSLRVDSVSDAQILRITAVNQDPKLCAMIANTVAKVFINEDYKIKRESKRRVKEYLNDQIVIMKNKLELVESQLIEFRSKNKNLDLNTQASEIINKVGDLELKNEKLKKDKHEKLFEIENIQKHINFGNYEFVSPIVFKQNVDLKKLSDDIFNLELELSKDLETYTENHPVISDKKKKLSELEKNFQILLTTYARKYLLDKQKELEEIDKQIKDNNIKISYYENLYREYPKQRIEYARLQRQYDIYNKLFNLYNTKLEEVRLEGEKITSEFRLLNEARVSGSPVRGQKNVIVAIGALIGAMLGLGLAFFIESLDTSIGTIEDVERFIRLPVISVIPHIEKAIIEKKINRELKFEEELNLVAYYNPRAVTAEAIRTLRTNIKLTFLKKGSKTLLITSSFPSEGKSTILANVAVSFAVSGSRTVLIDGNIRHPNVHKIFGIEKEEGLSEYLKGEVKDHKKLFRKIKGIENLNILTAGSFSSNPSELLDKPQMNELIEKLKEENDIILFDSPPILPVSDGLIIASKLDGVALVYSIGRAGREVLWRVKSLIDNANTNLLGIILNDVSAEGRLSYSYYYYYYYGYHSDNEEERKKYRFKDIEAV